MDDQPSFVLKILLLTKKHYSLLVLACGLSLVPVFLMLLQLGSDPLLLGIVGFWIINLLLLLHTQHKEFKAFVHMFHQHIHVIRGLLKGIEEFDQLSQNNQEKITHDIREILKAMKNVEP